MQFGELLEKYRSACTVGDASRAFSTALEEIGLSRFTYLGFPSSSSSSSPARIITTYPTTWRQRYFEANYDQVDPVVRHASHVEEPFSWGGHSGLVRPETAHEKRMFDEAADLEIRSGITIPIRDRMGRLCTISMTGPSETSLSALGDEKRQLLHLGAFYLHTTIARLEMQSSRDHEGRLSDRERAVLLWAARGKTAEEIGRILGITRRTTHFHIANCKKKLAATTVAEAVAKAVSRHIVPRQNT